MPVLRDWDLSIDVDMVLRAQGADPAAIRAKSRALVAIAERALAEGLPLLQPAVACRELAVEGLRHQQLLLAGGGTLQGPLIGERLASARRVAVVLCTVGPELEKRSSEVMAEDMLLGLALDGVGSAAAEALATEACRQLEAQGASEGLHAGLPLNPGMIGWPVEVGQPQVFALLDGGEVGITLTTSCMMAPRKSVSLVLGFTPEAATAGRPCDYCLMAASCRYQHLERTRD